MRSYGDRERAEAVGLAMTVGSKAAAERTGIPRRTVSYWLQHSEYAVKIEPATIEQVAAKLWEAIVTGTDAVLAGLRDPKARLGDKATALRVVSEQHALLTGRATARTENLNVEVTRPLSPEEDAQLDAFIAGIENASDDELRSWLANGGAEAIVVIERAEPALLTDGKEPGDV